MTGRSLNADWFSKPSDTIKDLMAAKGLTVRDLTLAIGKETAFTRDLMNGAARIDTELAQQLSNILGGSSAFWQKRQKIYEEQLNAVAGNIPDKEATLWLKTLPLSEMQKRSWIRGDKAKQLGIALAYFDVSSPEEWRERYGSIADNYLLRTSPTYDSSIGSLTAWLRQSEIEAELIDCAEWNPDGFQHSLQEIKKLTKSKNVTHFITRLQQICAASGVAVVFVETPKGCRASGATRFVSNEKALIALSFRYLSDDHFWFTFFHEAGHLLLHERNETFLETKTGSEDREKQEAEADNFARQILIPDHRFEDLFRIRPRSKDVIRMAISLGVSPGILVGQLQHLRIISYRQLNFLKRRFTWDEIRSAFD